MRRRRRRWAAAALLAAACSSASSHGAPAAPGGPVASAVAPAIVIDGSFDDWRGVVPVLTTRYRASAADSLGESTPLPQVVAVSARDDERYIYLRIALTHTANLLGLRGTMTIAFDADGDSTTGAMAAGLRGTDFTIDFSPPNAAGQPQQGVSLRAFPAAGAVRRADSYAVGLVAQPSVASREVELRVARGRRIGDSTFTIAPAFSGASYRARIVTLDQTDVVWDDPPAFRVALSTPARAAGEREAPTDPLARAKGTDLRVLQWNVANEGLKERPDAFRRVLDAVDPDILVLDEVGGVLGDSGVARFLATLGADGNRGTARQSWRFTYGGGGGYQRTVVASRNDVAEFKSFRFITFPDSTVERLLALMPASVRDRQRSSMRDGVATGAAIVTTGGRRLALVGVDLQSAGNDPRSWQEERRRTEARIIRDYASRAIGEATPRVDGVIAAGDFNLISSLQPVDIVRSIGLAFDGRPLDVANPYQLDGETNVTWAFTGPFPPGRLDWFSYSGRTLEVRRAFVFDAADIGDRWRRAHGLEETDSRRTSDHMPIVVDLKWRR